MSHIKLLLRYGNNNLTGQFIINRRVLNYLNLQICYNSNFKKVLNEENSVFEKIIYNEVLRTSRVNTFKHKKVSQSNEPIFLKYLLEEEQSKEQKDEVEDSEKQETVHFPYEPKSKFLEDDEINSTMDFLPQSLREFTPSENEGDKEFEWSSRLFKKKLSKPENLDRLTVIEDECVQADRDVKFEFGSFDINKAVSSIPCGGCGALLHCNDPAIPGFIPLEVFENKTKQELIGEICQRCVFLRDLDVALGVSVKSSEYSKIISKIKEKEALVILMIDLLDFPCSIYPGILDLIGPKPVVIVGNKVDLLIQDGPNFLHNFKESLIWSLRNQNMDLKNVKHISLISAQTGYGVEELIDVIYNNWEANCDIYLIGCTNAGKSTFFNLLIQSDVCKVKAVDILQRATTSAWPGTTMNLLKFPLAKLSRGRMLARAYRLKNERKELKAFQSFHWIKQNLKLEQIPLKGYVNRTTEAGTVQTGLVNSDNDLREGLNPAYHDFARGHWFFDTPGVVHKDQLVNLLTTAELLLTVPKKMLLPRNFHLKPGHSLFIGGLARLDYIKGADMVWFTVFASMELPLTVTKLEDANYVYEKLLGSPLFRVPKQGKERLSKWPELSSKKFEIVGKLSTDPSEEISTQAAADVVLSSAGWVSVTALPAHRCLIEAWTPEGRGIHLREIPLIRKSYLFRGPKIARTPAFQIVVKESKGVSFTDDPPF